MREDRMGAAMNGLIMKNGYCGAFLYCGGREWRTKIQGNDPTVDN
jgi:hypothetical protein